MYLRVPHPYQSNRKVVLKPRNRLNYSFCFKQKPKQPRLCPSLFRTPLTHPTASARIWAGCVRSTGNTATADLRWPRKRPKISWSPSNRFRDANGRVAVVQFFPLNYQLAFIFAYYLEHPTSHTIWQCGLSEWYLDTCLKASGVAKSLNFYDNLLLNLLSQKNRRKMFKPKNDNLAMWRFQRLKKKRLTTKREMIFSTSNPAWQKQFLVRDGFIEAIPLVIKK